MKHDRIMIVDYGSQYTQLITRRVRELKVYSEIFPYNVNTDEINHFLSAQMKKRFPSDFPHEYN